MASYQRLGNFFLADALAGGPAGQIHRGLSTAGPVFAHHHLIQTFPDELLKAGLAERWPDARRNAGQLAGARGFGASYRFEDGPPVFMVLDYLPGRSLAQVLERTRDEQVPLGVDHALTILQGLSQALLQLHERRLHHGALTPGSVWVGFEGAVHVLDAPLGPIYQDLLPKAPALKAALAPYRGPAGTPALQQDLFALGGILYELMTLEHLPAAAEIPAALARATLKAAQEEGPLPAEIATLLSRLLMVGQPYASVAEFNAALEKVLFEGDFSPTTFNMAFLMHTLFREEAEADGLAIKADQAATFAEPQGEKAAAAAPAKPASRAGLFVGIAAALVVGGGLFWYIQQTNRAHQLETQSMQDKLAAMQKEKEDNDAKLADLAKQEAAQKTLEDMFGQQAEQGTTEQARTTAKQNLEAAKQKTKELAKQREQLLKERQRLSMPAPVAAAPAAAPADTQPTVVQKGAAVTPAGAKAALPPSQQDSNIKVSLKVFVDAAGHPQRVVITKGVEGSAGYNDAAQNAALASTYTPGSKDGKPASGWVDMDFDFGKPK
jgi:uncharacterized surface protein with fasciclin (FAS1) repeats